MPSPRAWLTDFLNVLGGYFTGGEPPVPPVPPIPPTPPTPRGSSRHPRWTASLPPAYLAWLRQPIEWFDEWRQSIRARQQVKAFEPAFDFEEDFYDLLEIVECSSVPS